MYGTYCISVKAVFKHTPYMLPIVGYSPDFGLIIKLIQYFMYAYCEGSGETVRMGSIVQPFKIKTKIRCAGLIGYRLIMRGSRGGGGGDPP